MARSEATIRVSVPPRAAFRMWSDPGRLQSFLPAMLDCRREAGGSWAVTLQTDDGKEKTRVAVSVVDEPRRVVWRSTGGARWNGEVLFRPVDEGTEIRLIVDFEPSLLRERPTERGTVVPTWNVGRDLLAFRNYAEGVEVEQEDVAARGAHA